MPERASKRPQADALSTAIDAVKRAPDNDSHWDLVEELADTAQRPSDVRELFDAVLAQHDIDTGLASQVGKRAVRFFETWYGEESAPLAQLLARVLEIDPSAQWAFERLTVALTVAERWDELLAAYDTAIARADQTARRMKLLDEAAQAAKDFAGLPDRAIGYLDQLFALDPDNAALAASLERLLERQGRWNDLIKHWGSRIDMQPAKQQRDTRLRMASCYVESLSDYASALAEIDRVRKEAPEHAPTYQLLERILAAAQAPATERRAALTRLTEHYQRREKPREVVRVLGAGLTFASDDERRALLRELVTRELDLHEDAQALEHQAALLALEPMPPERDALRAIAERTRDFERYATALVAASAASGEPSMRVDLLLEAARLREGVLGQPAVAIELYERVFGAGGSPEATLAAGRRLLRLLEQTDRDRETLDVLSRMSELEPDVAVRRSMLGKLAALAERLGDKTRAQAAWRLRVGDDTSDVEALDALVAAAERDSDSKALARLLRQRIGVPGAAHRRRDDLAWLARLYDQEQNDLGSAIDTWRELQMLFPEDREAVTALTDLLSRAERWSELADVLKVAAQREISRFTELQTQLGDAYRQRLGEPREAVLRYRSALQVDPRHVRARAGQTALLQDEACKAVAADSLAEAYAATDEWQQTLALLPVRLQTEESETARAEMLIEAAQLHEQRGDDLEQALSCYRRGFTLIPDDRATEREIRRLAETLGQWDAVVGAYRDTIASQVRTTPRVAELRYAEGAVLETKLHDLPAALAAYVEAAQIVADRVELAAAVARLGARLGRWDLAAQQVVRCSLATLAIEPTLLEQLAQAAATPDSVAALCAALISALQAAPPSAPKPVVRDLYLTIAGWQRDRRGDAAAAEAALSRAVDLDPSHEAALLELARAQRAAPSPALVATLQRLARLDEQDLDPLYEAAEVAVACAPGTSLVVDTLVALYDRVKALWHRGQKATGERDAAAAARYAIATRVPLLVQAGHAAEALGLLLEASHLPLPPALTQGYLHEAAELASGTLASPARAIELYRDALARDAHDVKALAALAALYAREDRLPELLMLRRHELAESAQAERKLELRLEISQLLAQMESRGDRKAALLANLADAPGHEPTLIALIQLLRAQGQHAELAQLLQQQGDALAKRGRPQAAAWLLRELAQLREAELRDAAGAIDTYRELHVLEPDGDASESLARLYSELGDHAAAAEWLEIRLGTAPPGTRAVTATTLARAHIEAGQPARARSCLEQALAQDPNLAEARELLAELYRKDGAHESLARLLSESAELTTDHEARVQKLREAALLYYERLRAPDRAIPVLQRAVALLPDETGLRAMLGEGLRVAQRHDEAREVFKELIGAFGRRRSPERAQLHFQLARVAESAGAIDEALAELETATKMDLAHQGALHMLARLSRAQGDLDRSERAYRGLLLIVRRQRTDDQDAVGPSEIFYELYRIATERGQAEQARELLASAMEAATQSELEARRFTRVLRAEKQHELLLRVLDARLSLAREPETMAELLAAKADVLELEPARLAEALELRLRGLAQAPDSELQHVAARSLAVRMGELARYIDAVSGLADEALRERSPEASRAAAALTLRLGQVIEEELQDLDRAAGLYAKVEASGEHVVEAWLAMARVAGARGDRAEQRRVLSRIAELDPQQASAEARAEARFMLAELELADPAWRKAGIESLGRALDANPSFGRAKAAVTAALEAAPADEGVLRLYERVARSSRDDQMLLSWIERRAARPDATAEDAREGIELALRIGEVARAEALLQRAAEIARRGAAMGGKITWVFSGLAECRLQAADVRGAIGYLREAVRVAGEGEADALSRELAELASGPGGDLEVAAETYDRLLAHAPADRTLWEPMLSVLSQLRDRKRMDLFVACTLELLSSVEDRVFLLLSHAKFLGEVMHRDKDAVPVLRTLLAEDAGHLEATDRLLAIYQRAGMRSDLAELLTQLFDRARDERNVAAITELGLRLGALYGASQPHEAADAYRAALEWDPDHRGLLLALVDRLPQDADASERADISFRLLKSEQGEAAAELALEVAETCVRLSDDDRAREALELGYRACPEHDPLRDRLEAFYVEREQWRPLAELMVAEAGRLGQSMAAVGRLKNAATLYRDRLDDVDGSASALRAALAIVPDDLSLLGELARNLAAAGQHEAAIADVTQLLDGHAQRDHGRVDLLRVRADLLLGIERIADAVTDLEEAYGIAPAEVSESLVTALDRLREQAQARGEDGAMRSATLRLTAVLDAAGQHERARDFLGGWVERDPSDVESLRELRARDLVAERWQDVALSCERLISVEQGDARIDAALGLADAFERLGRAEDALSGLLRVHEQVPEALAVRERLRALFSRLGYKRELATMLVGDAELVDDPTQTVELLLQAVELFLEIEQPELATDPLMRAMELAPDNDRTRLLLVDVYLKVDRVDEATEIVEQAINAHKRRRSPELALFQQRMGRICALRGDPATQIKWLGTALDTDRKSGEIASELAEVSMSIEDYDTAMKALRTLTMMEDPRPITRALAFFRQAQIAVARGDKQRAQHWARKAKSLDENLAEVDEFLAQLGA